MPRIDIPPIRWGTFFDHTGRAHVAPAVEGYLMKGHVLKITCFCCPRVDKTPHTEIVIHEIVH